MTLYVVDIIGELEPESATVGPVGTPPLRERSAGALGLCGDDEEDE